VLHRDERLLVVDKPHFLAMTPRGGHITETALARLRRELGLPGLSPAHRLDRLTAGLALFVVQPAHRGRYQALFRDRRVHKEYQAVAPHRPELTLPTTVRSHIVKERGIIAAHELPDAEPNAESRIELVEHAAGLGRYRLLPATGRTHQLRLHMAALGTPILGDGKYGAGKAEIAGAELPRQLHLHARRLVLPHPVRGTIDVTAPLPPHMATTFRYFDFNPKAKPEGPED
jgi:tRNA pseudouridine32 synthase/23S rRNA pseudouridine746 synthase